jgi:hypothetical protein
MSGIDLSGEQMGKVTQVAEGFWILASAHHPGGSDTNMPEINNRAMIFRVSDGGEDVLAVFNAVDPGLIDQVHDLEKSTGLSVRYVVSVGGGHHLLMNQWHDAFPDAQLKLGPVRVPRTANGKALLAMDRVSVMELDDPLPQLAGDLEMVLFRGVSGTADLRTPIEGQEPGEYMSSFMHEFSNGMKDPYDELWLFHKATGTVVGGENLGWMFTSEDFARLPESFQGLLAADSLYIQAAFRPVSDAEAVTECWRKVLSWPAQTVISYHDSVGFGIDTDAAAALRSAVESVGQAGT